MGKRNGVYAGAVAGVTATALLAAGCSSSGGSGSSGSAAASTSSSAGSSASSSQAAGAVVVAVSSGKLVAPDGKTLYYNTVDTAKNIQCVGACADIWPPLVGMPKPGKGLDEHDLSTAMRSDGTTQITFYGHPLYEFKNDTAGSAKGSMIADQGGHWVVASPDQVNKPAAKSSAKSSSGGGGGYGP